MGEKRNAYRLLVEKPEEKRPKRDHQEDQDVGGWIILRFLRRLLISANITPSSPVLLNVMAEEIFFFETSSVLTRATRFHFPEDGVLHSHGLENLKSYTALIGWTL
jgi:hypothetical protein